jgi:hypothetical protein
MVTNKEERKDSFRGDACSRFCCCPEGIVLVSSKWFFKFKSTKFEASSRVRYVPVPGTGMSKSFRAQNLKPIPAR